MSHRAPEIFVVMATAGRGGVARLLMGRVADTVIASALIYLSQAMAQKASAPTDGASAFGSATSVRVASVSSSLARDLAASLLPTQIGLQQNAASSSCDQKRRFLQWLGRLVGFFPSTRKCPQRRCGRSVGNGLRAPQNVQCDVARALLSRGHAACPPHVAWMGQKGSCAM
jgi:hypothetical protein